jgi:Mor family transcriptional regulator
MSQEKTDRNQKMLKLKREGATYRQLADRYNLALQTVFSIIKRMEMLERLEELEGRS